MTKMTLPPRFKPFQGKMAPAAQKILQKRERGTAQERGYDAKWARLSIAYRKKHPFCEWCLQEDRDTLTDLVDHMVPVIDAPKLIHEWSNLFALCRHCHGRKYRMEMFARQNNQIQMLPIWCKEIEKRPAQFLANSALVKR